LQPLSPADVQKSQNTGAAVILDVRDSNKYANGHIRGSLHIALSGQFASWAGSLIRPASSIILVGEEEEQLHQARTRLSRVGLDQVVGYLDGGIAAWDRAELPLQKTEQIPVEELHHRVTDGLVELVLDVRRPAEWETGHIASARNTPLLHLAEEAEKMDPKRRVAVLCAGGFRSAIAASLLEQKGFEQVSNVVGGMAAWSAAKLPVAQ